MKRALALTATSALLAASFLAVSAAPAEACNGVGKNRQQLKRAWRNQRRQLARQQHFNRQLSVNPYRAPGAWQYNQVYQPYQTYQTAPVYAQFQGQYLPYYATTPVSTGIVQSALGLL